MTARNRLENAGAITVSLYVLCRPEKNKGTGVTNFVTPVSKSRLYVAIVLFD